MNNKFLNHEVMDRLSIICNNVNDYILEHPSVQSNPELKNKIESVLDQLHDCYQTAGEICFDDSEFEPNEQLKKGAENFKEKQKDLLIELMRGDEELGLYDIMTRDAYLAGFKNSAQGYNGEHPFEGKSDKKIWNSISEDYENWLDKKSK